MYLLPVKLCNVTQRLLFLILVIQFFLFKHEFPLQKVKNNIEWHTFTVLPNGNKFSNQQFQEIH